MPLDTQRGVTGESENAERHEAPPFASGFADLARISRGAAGAAIAEPRRPAASDTWPFLEVRPRPSLAGPRPRHDRLLEFSSRPICWRLCLDQHLLRVAVSSPPRESSRSI